MCDTKQDDIYTLVPNFTVTKEKKVYDKRLKQQSTENNANIYLFFEACNSTTVIFVTEEKELLIKG